MEIAARLSLFISVRLLCGFCCLNGVFNGRQEIKQGCDIPFSKFPHSHGVPRVRTLSLMIQRRVSYMVGGRESLKPDPRKQAGVPSLFSSKVVADSCPNGLPALLRPPLLYKSVRPMSILNASFSSVLLSYDLAERRPHRQH